MSDQGKQVDEPKTGEGIAVRPPLPPFNRETAIQKVRLGEDGWNSRNPPLGASPLLHSSF